MLNVGEKPDVNVPQTFEAPLKLGHAPSDATMAFDRALDYMYLMEAI